MTETSPGSFMVEKNDFDRLEMKVDELMQALAKLILIDERQMNQGQRIGSLEQRVVANYESLFSLINKNHEIQTRVIDLVDRKVNKWINMGIGGWAVISTGLLLYQMFAPHLH